MKSKTVRNWPECRAEGPEPTWILALWFGIPEDREINTVM